MLRYCGTARFHMIIKEANSPEEALQLVLQENPTGAEIHYAGEAYQAQIEDHQGNHEVRD